MFIVIEGIDAAGKTTQTTLLGEKLNAYIYRFPRYESPTGELIKEWLQREHEGPNDAMILQCLMTVNRMEVAGTINYIIKVFQRNIVADRYWPSGYVYGLIDGLDLHWLHEIHSNLPQPDIFILLDVDEKNSLDRRPERRDRYEQDGRMENRARLYRELWRVPPKFKGTRWVVVDGRGTVDEVAALVWKVVEQLAEELATADLERVKKRLGL